MGSAEDALRYSVRRRMLFFRWWPNRSEGEGRERKREGKEERGRGGRKRERKKERGRGEGEVLERVGRSGRLMGKIEEEASLILTLILAIHPKPNL
eukprot:1384333-Amorphochlora_amoeboformis.AAC.1